MNLEGHNDWLNLDLRQAASRRNWSPGDITVGAVEYSIAWSLEIAKDDLAQGDPGFGDPGFGDPGFGDPGFGDPGFETPASVIPDLGIQDSAIRDLAIPASAAISISRATDLAGAPFNLRVSATTNQAIILSWSGPTAGKVSKFQIWRAVGRITDLNQPKKIGETNGNVFTFADTSSKKGENYCTS